MKVLVTLAIANECRSDRQYLPASQGIPHPRPIFSIGNMAPQQRLLHSLYTISKVVQKDTGVGALLGNKDLY